jgi:uncharacterized tellurite resistance protein B-like protein
MHHISLGDPGASKVTLTQDQALAVIGLSAVSSDGRVENAELTALLEALARTGAVGDDGACVGLVQEVVRMADAVGLGPLTSTALATLEAERRELGLRVTFEVLMGDGDVPDAELEYVRELQRALGVSDERYDALLAAACE